MCDYDSTWDVIIRNQDFVNAKPLNPNNPAPDTSFKIVYPDEGGRFVLVSDRSGSMADPKRDPRMDRLKQSASRWLNYDVEVGTKIGLVSFSYGTSIDLPLTEVADNNRKKFLDAIDILRANGGTCMGDGLMRGMDVSIIGLGFLVGNSILF